MSMPAIEPSLNEPCITPSFPTPRCYSSDQMWWTFLLDGNSNQEGVETELEHHRQRARSWLRQYPHAKGERQDAAEDHQPSAPITLRKLLLCTSSHTRIPAFLEIALASLPLLAGDVDAEFGPDAVPRAPGATRPMRRADPGRIFGPLHGCAMRPCPTRRCEAVTSFGGRVPRRRRGRLTCTGVTHETTTSRLASSPNCRWSCSGSVVPAIAGWSHSSGAATSTSPIPRPRTKARRETVARISVHHLARARVQHQSRSSMITVRRVEIEEVRQRRIARVEGLIADLAQVPVVLDEPQDRGLAARGMVHEIPACKGRYHQQRLTWPETTAGLVRARLRGAAAAWRSECVVWIVRLAQDRAEQVVVPAVGVVVGDDNCRGVPARKLLKAVDGLYQERLLVQRIGVASVAVLVTGRLEVANGRQFVRICRGPEIRQIILVIGRPRMPDLVHGCRCQVGRICGLRKVLERFMVRDVIRYGRTGHVRMSSAAYRLTARVYSSWTETTLEPAPADVFRVEQIADVRAGHGDCAGTLPALIQRRARVADDAAVADAASQRDWRRAVRLARDQIQGTRSRRPKRVAEGVVAHREVLRVIPERRHGVSVVVVHHQ